MVNRKLMMRELMNDRLARKVHVVANEGSLESVAEKFIQGLEARGLNVGLVNVSMETQQIDQAIASGDLVVHVVPKQQVGLDEGKSDLLQQIKNPDREAVITDLDESNEEDQAALDVLRDKGVAVYSVSEVEQAIDDTEAEYRREAE